jgi:hypothetical protein
MNIKSEEEVNFFQHINSQDTFKLSILCAFQEGFENSFYANSLDEQKRVIERFIPIECKDLAEKLEAVTVENATSFFRDFFTSSAFKRNFNDYFDLQYENICQRGSAIARTKMAKQLIAEGMRAEKISVITNLTIAEVEALM